MGVTEIAVINIHGTGSPSAAVNDVLYIVPMASVNGAAFASVMPSTDSAASLSVGTANASVSKRITLAQNTTYIFGAGFASNAAVTISAAYCQGTVTIIRQ
jgi:hypothetical protein